MESIQHSTTNVPGRVTRSPEQPGSRRSPGPLDGARTNQKVCVVGAGASGLPTAKTLHERGIPFDCFEMGSGIGGLWRYQNDNGRSAAYRSLHVNTSRDKTAYIDYPMSRDYPDFPHHSLLLKYLEDYTDHFGFRDEITFQTSVVRVEPQSDRSFLVTTESRAGHQQTRQYSAVLIANGHHWSPRYPKFPGHFSRDTIHAHQYRTPDAMTGKRVLVVGMGNSACDIACECSRVADRVFMSTRRGAHLIPKYMFGRPLDRVVPRWMWTHLPFHIFQWMFGMALRIARGNTAKFGLPVPAHRILEEHPTISSDLLNLIGHGAISIKPSVRELDGDHVSFEDGSREQIDMIVCATGYDISVPFLDDRILMSQNNEVRLYKHVVHPDHPGLYFIGLVQPWGAMLRLAEQQAKWVADLIDGKCGLPTVEDMKTDIAACRAKMRRRYTESARHTIQVDFYRYMTDLQREQRRPASPITSMQPTSLQRRAA